jgi:hypothetical protein
MTLLRRTAAASIALLALSVVSPARADGEDDYPLDGTSRTVPAAGRVPCPTVDLVTYPGKVVRYHAPVRVHAAFVERLGRFEEIVRDVAVEVYGRAPRRIHHLGSFSCRRINGYPTLVSEHGLGNAIDVDAFEFDALPKSERKTSSLPAGLRNAFRVSLLAHWRGTGPVNGMHQRFLHTVAQRLIARRDVFRVLLGPSYPGHLDHFHFDVAPYRLVDVFDPPSPSKS